MKGRALLAASLLVASSPALSAEPRVWSFRVYLDDAPIGHHSFTLRETASTRELTSEARFTVKVLGINAYRYAHNATEHWRGDCLNGLTARTDDNGEPTNVNASRAGERLTVSGNRTPEALSGCVMTFAYWNPAILRESRLLNAQTGEYEAVRVALVGEEKITLKGAPVTATRYRITGSKHPIDLWYSPDNEWLQLESTISGGRKLRYRL